MARRVRLPEAPISTAQVLDPPAPALTLPKVVGVRIPALDGLRGIAILAVVLYHIDLITGPNSPYDPGWTGVDLFFVVSGFLITGILLDSRRDSHYFGVFYARRTLRIFPIYYASLACFFLAGPAILHALGREESIEPLIRPSSRWFAWLYILNWLMGARTFNAVGLAIQHFWSLSVEEQFYLCWPALVRWLGSRKLLVLCAVLTLAAPCLRLIFRGAGLPAVAFAVTICRCDGLAIGAAIAIAARSRSLWELFSRWAPRIACASLAASGATILLERSACAEDIWIGTVGISFASLFFGSALVSVLNAPYFGPVSKVLRRGPLPFFGKYSYAIYIFHQPIVLAVGWRYVLYHRLASPLGPWGAVVLLWLVVTALTTVLALISWRFVEKPCLDLKERVTAHLRDSRRMVLPFARTVTEKL